MGMRAVEASQINLSLLMLGNVISKLSEGAEGRAGTGSRPGSRACHRASSPRV